MKLIRPQSRFLMKTLFKRNYDTFSESSKGTVDNLVLLADIAVVVGLIVLL